MVEIFTFSEYLKKGSLGVPGNNIQDTTCNMISETIEESQRILEGLHSSMTRDNIISALFCNLGEYYSVGEKGLEKLQGKDTSFLLLKFQLLLSRKLATSQNNGERYNWKDNKFTLCCEEESIPDFLLDVSLKQEPDFSTSIIIAHGNKYIATIRNGKCNNE